MKVNVLTNADIAFKKWQWWSNWIDVAVFESESRAFLIQMKISRSNSKKFTTILIPNSGIFYRQCSVLTVGDLTAMRREK